MEHPDATAEALNSLTAKQREVLDLVLQHKTSKEIARALGISPDTVDQRISFARKKLGASSRNEAALIYANLTDSYNRSVYGLSDMESSTAGEHLATWEPSPIPSHLMSGTLHKPVLGWPVARRSLEALDNKFGILGRVGVIIGIAFVIAILALAILAMVEAFSRLT